MFMKTKLIVLCSLLILFSCQIYAQANVNPYADTLRFENAPGGNGYDCGSAQTLQLHVGLSTPDDASDWSANPLQVSICLSNLDIINANSITGDFSTYFTWSYNSGTHCLQGVQQQTIPGTTSGWIQFDVNVQGQLTQLAPLSATAQWTIPSAISAGNSISDDNLQFTTTTNCPLHIQGQVVNDLTPFNSDINGNPLVSSDTFYIHLVDQFGLTLKVQMLAADAAFSFAPVQPNTTYGIVLSNTKGMIGQPAPTQLFSQWAFTGEQCCSQNVHDGIVDGRIDINVVNDHITQVMIGVNELMSIGNQLWHDTNANGMYDNNEPGLANFALKLYRDADANGLPDSGPIASTQSDANGRYKFNSLFDGNYLVSVIPPVNAGSYSFESSLIDEVNSNDDVDNNDNGIITNNGEIFSSTISLSLHQEPISESNNNASATDANANLTIDFGFFQRVTIAGNIFNDNNGATAIDGYGVGQLDGNSLFMHLMNASHTIIQVVPVTGNGAYAFDNVLPNQSYTLFLSHQMQTIGDTALLPSLPIGWIFTGEDCCDQTGHDGDMNGVLDVNIELASLSHVDFAVRQALSLGNQIWNDEDRDGIFDSNENGVANVIVNLYLDANGNNVPDGPALQTTQSNNAGVYTFYNLYPGNYIVGITPPVPMLGNAFVSSTLNEANPNLNGDGNDNGATLVGNEIRSMRITLSANAEPIGELPLDALVADANANFTLDFGIYQPIQIDGHVVNDEDGDLNVNGTGIGLPDGNYLFVNLVSATGITLATDTVDANGNFQIADVFPNTMYTLNLSTTKGVISNLAPAANVPFGWINTGDDCCDGSGNDGTQNGVLSLQVLNENIQQVRFGIRQSLSIGNLVWKDTDRDGVKDANEFGLAGAQVFLYQDANADDVPDGAAIQSMTTNASGTYAFEHLYEGTYLVGVVPPAVSSGHDYISSSLNQELDPNLNIDLNDIGVISSGNETRSQHIVLGINAEPLNELPASLTAKDVNSNYTLDFGFYQPISLQGNVMYDITGPTQVDGAKVTSAGGQALYANLIQGTTVVNSMMIDTNGQFYFYDVTSSTNYKLNISNVQGVMGSTAPTATLPAAWSYVAEDCCDGIGNDGTANGSLSFNSGTANVTQLNFGLRDIYSVGNMVWIDANRNGLKDASENAMNNASVKLYADADANGLPDGAELQSTTTSANGLFIFNTLIAGSYVIGVTPPSISNGQYSSSVNGEELNANSDVDQNDNGIVTSAGETFSSSFTLGKENEPLNETPSNAAATMPDANTNLSIDFGFFACPNSISLSQPTICANATFELTSLEPSLYAGGTWSQQNLPLTSTLVPQGTYVYTYQEGTCILKDTIVVGNSIPDFTATLSTTPSAITGVDTVRIIIKVEEIRNQTSCAPIYVLMPKLAPRYTFNYDSTATSVLGTAVQNNDWQLFSSNANYFIWKYKGTSFPTGGASKIGFYGLYNSNSTDGETNFTVQVFQGSGGESQVTNNSDAEILLYFK
jgi:protocatechuate 3,4-dioxygenase beta subunit